MSNIDSNSTILYAGTYHIIQSGEASLVGTRSGILAGLIPNMLNLKLPDESKSLPKFLKELYESYDLLTPIPHAGILSSIDYGSNKITFVPDLEMGRNHCGWSDGLFVISDELYNDIVKFARDSDRRFDPMRGIVHFENDTVLSVNSNRTFSEVEEYSYSYLHFNHELLGDDDLEFAGEDAVI